MGSFLTFFRTDLLILKDILASVGFVLQVFRGAPERAARLAGCDAARSAYVWVGDARNHRRNLSPAYGPLLTPSVKEVNNTNHVSTVLICRASTLAPKRRAMVAQAIGLGRLPELQL